VRRTRQLWLAAASTVVAFLLTIAVDRVAALVVPKSEALVFPPNSRFRMETKEFDYTANVNSLGFRDRAFDARKSDVPRALAIGDSFTYGWGVQDWEAWPKVLERELWRRGVSIEIANLGRPGAGPNQYLRTAEEAIPLLKPKWVLIGLLQGDDLNQSQPPHQERKSEEEEKSPVLNALYPTLSQVAERLTIDRALDVTPEEAREKWREQVQQVLARLKPGERQRFDALDRETREQFLRGELNPDIIGISLKKPQYASWVLNESADGVQTKVRALAEDLAALRQLAERHGAELVVVSIPHWPYVTHPQSLSKLGLVLTPEMLSTEAPDDEARQACREAGVEPPIVVTHDIRKRAAAGEPLYYPNDGHFTPEGQRVFAESVAPQISAKLGDERN